MSYDAWGCLRDPATQKVYGYGQQPKLFLGRGYTGHEHLVPFGLINMNARLYDPVLGRFLSPDPNVQCPDWTQNLNRYTYAMNNPLCYIDEDGEFFWFVVGAAALVGGVVNVANHWKDIKHTGGWKGFWKGAGYFTIGAVAGGAGAAVGIGAAVGFGSALTVTATGLATASSGILSGVYIGATSSAVESFILTTSNSLFDGNSLMYSLHMGIKDGFVNGVIGGVTGGITGGAKAAFEGENIWKGVKGNSFCEPYGNFCGYFGYDDKGNIKYVGITSRDPKIRFWEHLNSKKNRNSLFYEVVTNNLTKTQARIWEQKMIKTPSHKKC